jgi:hypothetical protein
MMAHALHQLQKLKVVQRGAQPMDSLALAERAVVSEQLDWLAPPCYLLALQHARLLEWLMNEMLDDAVVGL